MTDPRDGSDDVHKEIGALATETVNEAYQDLDLMSTRELVDAMNREDARVSGAVAAQSDAIASAVDAIAARMAKGGRLLYIGAGTPGRLGVLDASEIPPTFGLSPDVVIGVIAGGDSAIRTAAEGAEDSSELGAADIASHDVTELDSVVGISASGRTPYVRAALHEARQRGALTIGVACNAGSPLGRESDIGIEVVVGPEIVTGSTRLKAGTAQKMVLNMLSTLVMVKRGKTYGNLMVDVKVTNKKLRARAERTVMLATGAEREDASRVLRAAGGSVKTAILTVLSGVSVEEATQRLADADGFLRHALRDITEEQ